MARPGLTRVWNVPRHSPPRTLTAPISVIMSSARLPPVVSRSSTQNVVSWSGDPRSSKLRCPNIRADMHADAITNIRSRQEHVFGNARSAMRYDGGMSRPAVEPRYLRSALEFAVLMAAEGQKFKPPMAYPAGLKKYFRVDRIPTQRVGLDRSDGRTGRHVPHPHRRGRPSRARRSDRQGLVGASRRLAA